MDKPNIHEHFSRVTLSNKLLFSPSIEITDSCNASCVFCYRGQGVGDLPTAHLPLSSIRQAAKEMAHLGAFHLQISGGEPLCHPEIENVLEIVRENGFAVTLITNGVLLNDQIIRAIKSNRLYNIIVSMHTMDKTSYSEIMGLRGELLDRVIENVHKLIKSDISVQISSVLTRLNIDGYKDLFQYWKEYDIPVNWQRLVPTVDGSNRDLLPSFDQLVEFYRFLGRESIPRTVSTKSFKCNAGINGIVVNASGTVLPCPFLRLEVGHLDDSLLKVWHPSACLTEFREKAFGSSSSICSDCPSSEFCDVCIAGNMNATGDMFTVDEDFCVYAHSARKVFYESE